ncbi:type II toxin-antitoxin system RelE/ParE family toxin [Tistrella mobilis]
MLIRNILHKGLRRFVQSDDPSGLDPAVLGKLRRMISFLQAMSHEDELLAVASWKPHRLSGDRKGSWALSVTRNWRLTFYIDGDAVEIVDLNYEDYH